jgi:Tfp pilus assembly protein PilP
MAMKLTTGILAIAITAGAAWGQNQDAIDSARSVANLLPQKQANTNAVLYAAAVPPQAAKPTPGSPAPAIKPATVPDAKTASAPAAKPASTSGPNNKLQHVNVVQGSEDIRVEISSSRAVTAKVSKLSSPARVLVELPETIIATSQNHIPVGNAGVKGLRIGMDGKTPPTTSIVVDLEKAIPYELTPGSGDKLVLTLHTQGAVQGAAKSNPASVKTTTAAAQPQPVPKNPSPAATPQPVAAKPAVATKPAVAAKPAVAVAPALAAKAAAPKPETTKIAAPKETPKDAKAAALAKNKPAADAGKKPAASQPKPEEKKWAMTGKRDPFFSPVVQQAGGSGCSAGKKCLEINAINLRGVVKSDNGFIAVVTNTLNKAYFLRENDPVFNGYVVKITGDSVVFQETVQDKLGKSFTREVVKRLFTPAV